MLEKEFRFCFFFNKTPLYDGLICIIQGMQLTLLLQDSIQLNQIKNS